MRAIGVYFVLTYETVSDVVKSYWKRRSSIGLLWWQRQHYGSSYTSQVFSIL